ncbi:MAG: hypothetical protein KAF91_25880 [Nostoc sp. TH1S01]|nr:hypothetical protein [Nostoc sp. TH1S01]
MKLSTCTAACTTVVSVIFSAGIVSAQPRLDKTLNVKTTAETSHGQAISTSVNTYMSRNNNTPSVHIIQPFNLVYLAYQGNLQPQGIPGGGSLMFQHHRGRINAKDVVKAAVDAKKLPNQMLQDSSYISQVNKYLMSVGTTFVN